MVEMFIHEFVIGEYSDNPLILWIAQSLFNAESNAHLNGSFGIGDNCSHETAVFSLVGDAMADSECKDRSCKFVVVFNYN